MDLALKIVLSFFGLLALDRILLFFERRYYAKYNKFLFTNTDEKDLKIGKEQYKFGLCNSFYVIKYMSTYFNDLTNKQFGRLTVLSKTSKRISKSIVWLCKCSCGKLKEINGAHLRTGNTLSCGCIKKRTKFFNLYQRLTRTSFWQVNSYKKYPYK